MCVCVDWLWLFPAEPKVLQLAGWYLWVTRQTSAGREGTEDRQHDDWIPDHLLWSERRRYRGDKWATYKQHY